MYNISGYPPYYDPFAIHKSLNYGITFDTTYIDTAVAGYVLSGYYPTISRGAQAGEIYLVSWNKPGNYKIFYSNDYGKTFELKYTSDICNFYYWGFYFTAGKEPSSFYVIRNTYDEYDYHAQTYIDYSQLSLPFNTI